MSDINYFQVKIKSCPTAESRKSAESLGLSSWAWVIRNATWCEDYFDLDKEDIDAAITRLGDECYMLIQSGDQLDDDSDLIELFVRRVPTLGRHAVLGFVISDDIAVQMADEATMLAEESIPPGTGESINWFRSAVKQLIQSIETGGGTFEEIKAEEDQA